MLDHIDPVFQQTVFSIEEDFDHRPWLKWFSQNWSASLWASLIYVIAIFSIRRIMRDREALNLRFALVMWSLILAVFSTVCAWRLWGELLLYKNLFGWKATMCEESIGYSGVNGYWSLLFVMSKLPELGDTLFVVLRKQPLIFLHWYHHITVFVYSWYSYQYMVAPGRYFILMNASVHSIMYSYYALRCSRILRIPRQVNVCITLIQMSQMVVGLGVNLLALYYRSNGQHCSTTDQNITVALMMYASYFVLFANYFFQAYLAKRSKKAAAEKNANGHAYKNGTTQNGIIPHTNYGHITNGYSNGTTKSHKED